VATIVAISIGIALLIFFSVNQALIKEFEIPIILLLSIAPVLPGTRIVMYLLRLPLVQHHCNIEVSATGIKKKGNLEVVRSVLGFRSHIGYESIQELRESTSHVV